LQVTNFWICKIRCETYDLHHGDNVQAFRTLLPPIWLPKFDVTRGCTSSTCCTFYYPSAVHLTVSCWRHTSVCKVPASAGAFDNCSIRIWQEKSACCGRIASPHCVYVLRSLRTDRPSACYIWASLTRNRRWAPAMQGPSNCYAPMEWGSEGLYRELYA